MPIKWSVLKVSEAMDMAEEFVNQAIEPLEQALIVAEAASQIDNLPGYVTDRIGRLAHEIKRAIGGVMFGQETSGSLRASIESIRNAIPDGTIEAEQESLKYGSTPSLV